MPTSAGKWSKLPAKLEFYWGWLTYFASKRARLGCANNYLRDASANRFSRAPSFRFPHLTDTRVPGFMIPQSLAADLSPMWAFTASTRYASFFRMKYRG